MQGVDVDMDINILRGAILIVLIVSFMGLWAWAWSGKRKAAFDEASMLPLEEDNGQTLNNEGPADGKEVNHVD
jgi:cytochrome c oxidase cbb3-type subunit 4